MEFRISSAMLYRCSNEYAEPALKLDALSLLFGFSFYVVIQADVSRFDVHEVETEP